MADEPQPTELAGIVDRSQHGEVSLVAGLIGPDWPRYVVDVGAHDGTSLSNSAPFVEAGWGGLLVEPSPAAFVQLERRYSDRPDVRCVAAACADSGGTRPLALGADGELTMGSTLSGDTAAGAGHSVPVRVERLTALLDECRAPADFSLLTVDAERMDYEVLAGLDWERYRPRVVVTEDDVADPGRQLAKYELLLDRGYLLCALLGHANSIWLAVERAPEALSSGGPASEARPARELVDPSLLERRCRELERSRDEVWNELATLRASRSWRLTRPLRRLAAAARRSP